MTRKNDMTQEENNPLIPKLRFPEFRNAGGWRTVQLSEVLDYERPDRYIVNDTNYVNDGIPVLTANKSFVIGYTRETENVYTDVPVVIFDDFTTDKKLVTFAFKVKSSAIKILKAKKGDDLRLLYELMAQIKFDAQEHKRYYISEYQYIKIPLPEINEQKKIAECLSTLDELIEAESRKLNALKDHKKGLMQQLFPREGETRPRLRFAEFRASSDWERGVVRNIATVLQGYGFPEKYQGNTSAEFPFYKVSDISRTLAAGRHLMDEAANYIDHETLEKLKAKPIPAGTTIFAKIGEALRLNRRALTTRPCLIDNNTAGVKAIEEKATDLFLYYLFSTISLEKHAGGVVPAVSKTAIEEIEILYPKRDEQARIATFLSSIDDLIAAQSEKLEVLRTHKRGLMQQLFPSPDAIDL